MADADILVIDDDLELAELLRDYLGQEGLTIDAVSDGAEGLERALHGQHSLVVLDVMLPSMNGFEVLRHLRSESRKPVLMLTARGDDIDRIVGLEMGADDYLPKPFNPRELVARIRAIQRRLERPAPQDGPGEPHPPVRVDDVELSPATRVVKREGDDVQLTGVEFAMLEVLLRSAGRVVSRSDISETALGRPLSAYDRSIDVHISSLRKKLGARVRGTERIKTVRGVGYLYAATDEA